MELAVHSDEVIRIGKILGRDVGKYEDLYKRIKEA